MDSINRNQPEDNHRDLLGTDAVEYLTALHKKTQTCFFRTRGAQGPSGGTRPMNVRKVDERGRYWFLSASDSHKNLEIAADPSVELYLQETEHSGFVHLTGRATVSRDPARIKELWEPILRTWFTEGIDDPRITVIEVMPTDGYYWDNKHGDTVAGIKMLVGAATGKTLDDSIEGRLSVAG